MSDDIHEHRLRFVLIGLFVLIAVLIGWDLLTDYRDGVDMQHLLVESAILLLAALGAAFLLRQFHTTRAELAKASDDALRWRQQNQEILSGLGAAIKTQFTRWRLTPAEAEVGLMLLKGYSHKEIAALRQASERTIREQARAIYRKAGLTGRASLAAFFLEDLLLPHENPSEQ
jgi:DNA-binding NarL/FixJ family response regulator